MALPEEGPVETDISLIMAFGDADFVANSNIGRGSGLDMFVNSTNYLLGDYSLVSIRPKALAFREFNLDRNEYNFVRFSSWLFLPGPDGAGRRAGGVVAAALGVFFDRLRMNGTGQCCGRTTRERRCHRRAD